MDKPNLLFIFTDEQRFDTLKCYGNDFVEAPRLNALAEESFVFERAYVTQPICTPSRSTIMTGLYPHTTGCLSNNMALKPDTKTIAEMVDDDYFCAYIGKWHLGDEVIPQHGFEHWVSLDDKYRAHLSKPEYRSRLSDYHRFLVEQGFEPDMDQGDTRVFSRPFAAKLDEPYTKATFVGQQTAQLLREIERRPFVFYVNMLEPHMPFTTADQETRRVLGLPWRTVISADRWKLNLSPEDQCELFDLNTDPHEATNRFDDPGQQERIRDLRGRIARWQERTGDEAPLPAP